VDARAQLSFFGEAPSAKVLSYGGGLDSFAMLLDAIERAEPPDVVVFVDIADAMHEDPGEWPGTYRHVREQVIPLCARLGVPFVWLDSTHYPVRGARSLFAWLRERRQIPVAGPSRVCTSVAKVERFERWMDDTFPGRTVEVWVGFEAGEEGRAERDPNAGRPRRCARARRINRFPLIERALCRCRCEALVRRLGYPVPRKSACVFCPYASRGDWQTFARELPGEFAQVVELEAAKPPTRSGQKLSIMGYRTIKDDTGRPVGYKAPPLPTFIQGAYRPKVIPCGVCGATQRATKATGCGFLDEAA
jgi:hypothetical protein